MFFLNNAGKDAKKIHEQIEYKVIRAAFDAYVRLKKHGYETAYDHGTQSWFALYEIENNYGSFKSFDIEDIHLLESLTGILGTYKEILAVLEQHKNDAEIQSYIYATHPNLFDIVPEEYNDPEMIVEYLILVLTRYRDMLLEFYNKYKSKIEAAIVRVKKN